MNGAVIDVDGTVLRGDIALDGAPEGLEALRGAGVRIAFFSNNPTVTSEDLRRRLEGAGIETDGAIPLTSVSLTARYIEESCAVPVYVTGEKGVIDALVSHGIRVTEEPEEAGTSVVSVDRSLRYEDIRDGYVATTGAEDYVCTDPDAVVPTGDGEVPGSGAIEAAVSRAAGREPVVVGKPSEYAGEAVLDALGTRPGRTAFLGDRIDTDIALGESVGATTAAVLTGVTDEDEAQNSGTSPDHVLGTLAGVTDLL